MALLRSMRFSGDTELEKVRLGGLRLGAPGTAPFPAPVLSSGPAVAKVQQALMDIGYPMPLFGADGSFGAELGGQVTVFKTDWHLSPRDPVVGVKTITALDKEMVAFERPAPVPPPAPTPPAPIDQFGRRPSDLAKLPAALATVAAFTAPFPGSWAHLDRSSVAAGIADRVNDPDGAQQSAFGLCTTAAFVNVWSQDAPDAYAAFATTLFNQGAAHIAPSQNGAGQLITASAGLRNTDFANVMARVTARGLPVHSQADWMVMSAIRDSTNHVVAFTGDPDDWISKTIGDGASPFGDLDGWLRNADRWAVVDNANVLLTASLSSAMALDPANSRCILTIDCGMLTNDTGGHSVILRSPVTQASDGSVKLRIWSWAGLRDVHVSQEKFEDTYYGANIGFL